MIVIIDYGMGNLKSVANALNKLGITYRISSDIDVIKDADGLILPGVGSFSDAMNNIDDLVNVIKDKVNNGYPLLGICLGMQMLYEKGFENGEKNGFGFLKGNIKRMQPIKNVKIPHIGWNSLKFVEIVRDSPKLLEDCLKNGPFMYFVHSYYAEDIDEEQVVAYSEYGGSRIPALVCKGKVWGAQFHPEKSGEDGLEILRAFGEMVI